MDRLFWWSLRLIGIGIAGWAALKVLGQGWSLVLPLVLAVLLSAVLWPLTQLLRRAMPRLAASLASLVLVVAAVGGVFAALVPNIAGQAEQIGRQAVAGLARIQEFVSGPPLNLGSTQIDALADRLIGELQSNAQNIAAGVVSGASSVGNGVVTAVLVIVLTFFCLAEGDRLLPWSRRWLSERSHTHVTALGARTWTALRGYIASQAAVAVVDAVCIGIGLALLGVPLALPLAVLIFFAAFIPIVGAIVSGAVAVLIALVTLGWVQALVVLAIVLVVQQVEGHVLQPLLVGRSLALHPVVVIAAVTFGTKAFGITGAFLAVPATAVIAVIARYVLHQLNPAQPELPARSVPKRQTPEDGPTTTESAAAPLNSQAPAPEGAGAADPVRGEQSR